MVRPKYVLPIHGGYLDRKYHRDVAVEAGLNKEQVILVVPFQSFP